MWTYHRGPVRMPSVLAFAAAFGTTLLPSRGSQAAPMQRTRSSIASLPTSSAVGAVCVLRRRGFGIGGTVRGAGERETPVESFLVAEIVGLLMNVKRRSGMTALPDDLAWNTVRVCID